VTEEAQSFPEDRATRAVRPSLDGDARNVTARPEAKLQIGNQLFTGRVEVIADRATIEHVTDLIAAKCWYTWPYVVLARLLGWQVPSPVFRVIVARDESVARAAPTSTFQP